MSLFVEGSSARATDAGFYEFPCPDLVELALQSAHFSLSGAASINSDMDVHPSAEPVPGNAVRTWVASSPAKYGVNEAGLRPLMVCRGLPP